MAGHGQARRGYARLGTAGQGVAWPGGAWQGPARRGVAWLGEARQGEARRGTARQGNAGRGKAGRGMVRPGKAGLGKARTFMTQWHAIRVRPRAEGPALIGVEALGLEGYLPVELYRCAYRGTRSMTWRPIFPRYLFVQLTPERDLSRVLALHEVMEVLRMGGNLAPIAPQIIDAIRAAERAGAFDHARAARLGHGETVRVIEGPLAALVGKIRSASPARRVELVGNFAFRLTAPVDKLEKVRA
jgi:transcriptional antiterminator RfaH